MGVVARRHYGPGWHRSSSPLSPSRSVPSMTTASTTGVSLPLIPGRWAVDPHHSFVGFAIRHLGVSKVRGRFNRFDAEIVVGDTLEPPTLTATVAVASIDTANADRDKSALSP